MHVPLVFLILALGLGLTPLSAQEHQPEHKEGHFRVAALILHTFIPTDTPTGAEVLILPTLGFDVEYWFNPRWAIGLHNDIELESFEVETEAGDLVKRKTPLVFTLDAIWKPKQHWVFLAGPGLEYTPEETFSLFRLGLEYEFEFVEGIDLSPNVVYDIRNNAFDTFSYGLGVGFRF